MTGHGAARVHREGYHVYLEVRTINSRYYKLSVRVPEGFAALEASIDDVVRRHVRRGTVQVDARVERDVAPDNFRINEAVLAGYARQLRAIRLSLEAEEPIRLESLLLLPGVVDERSTDAGDLEELAPLIDEALVQALEHLKQMRAEEGKAMAADLLSNCQLIAEELQRIEQRAPVVAENYRGRLTERLNRLLADYQVEVEAADIVREVGLFAERSDISEEVVRLRSHLDQFQAIMGSSRAEGRKLEFVTQEMFREANTIGSKSNDADIAHRVVEIKAAIERIREMIQNVE
jgi:uncharacterized protein (TIGR00255 family)